LYFHDFNNDGLVDVASSSFHSFGAQDDESSWLYLNIGKENDPNFQLISKSWLQEDMIEHGSNAHPCFVDYNGDGLMDLVIGNRFTVLGNDNIYSSLRLYENIGSETNPEFSLIDEDWLNLSASGFSEIHPTFGDIDNDSDLDLIIGEENGRLYLFRNESGTSTEITVSDNEQILENNLDNLDFGIGSKPQLVDLNQDGMLDLVVGELFGRIYYVQNTGTADEFSFSVITENLGNISIDGDVFEANVVPYMYLNQGEWNLVVGNMNGHVQRYVSAGDLSNDFIRIDQELFSANDGTFSSPTVFDIDGDGYQDLIIGNARGGVSLYKGQFFDQVHEIRQSEVLIYPNPTGDALSIHLNEGSIFRSIQLYTVHGTLQMNIKFSGRSSKSIDLSDLADGVYILNIETEEGQLKKKIVKNSGLSH
jgi:hypothetical protein